MAIPKFKSRATDAIAVYEIIRRLSTPFEDTEAYEAGLIDEKGNFTKKRNQMSRDEKKMITRFDIMIFNIKKLLQRLPGGDSKLRNFATALFLLKEDVKLGTATEEDVSVLAEDFDFSPETKTLSDLTEEIATSIGSGSVDDKTVAVKNKKPKTKCSTFGRCMVFEVDTDTFMKIRQEKKPHDRYDKYLPDDHLDSVRDYAAKNPGKSIMISDEKSGAMSVLKMGKNQKW